MSLMQDTLSNIPLFEGLDSGELDRIAEIGRVEYFPAGKTILEEGEAGPRLLVILSGRVDVLRADPSGVQRSIAVCGPGDVLGEISLLLELPRSATVRALDDLKCFTMDRGSFQDMVDAGDPAALKMGMSLARSLATRILTLNTKVLKLLADTEDGTRLHDRFESERQTLFRLWP
ncbi:MAG: cyclic nucleotide-binding domain-containing protein [Alphaproteobacteria bacterium]|nr:cyclic nucleotide-binding domain-containing protein [Alphaproteobacteria bacterium]